MQRWVIQVDKAPPRIAETTGGTDWRVVRACTGTRASTSTVARIGIHATLSPELTAGKDFDVPVPRPNE